MNADGSPRSGWLRDHAAAVVVWASLGAVALYGHHVGWTISKRSMLTHAKQEKEDWCEAHNVPDSKCIACHPELGGGDAKNWCKEHGVPETQCTVCHPEILTKGQAADWCKEHGVPESQCTACHPEIAVKGDAPAPVLSLSVTRDPSAQAAGPSRNCQTHATRVQFASPNSIKKAGLALEAVQERPMIARLDANGEVEYDQTRVARISPRAPGVVWRVEKVVGDAVKKGEILALVDSAEVGRAKAELLQAVGQTELRTKTLTRVTASAATGLRTAAELQEAEAALRESRIRLFNAQQALLNLGMSFEIEEFSSLSEKELIEKVRLLGLPEAAIKSIGKATTANLLPLTAPLDGVVVAREGVAGEMIDSSRALFVVADPSHLWVTANVRLEDSARLALGHRVVFRPDGDSETTAIGKVVWIGTALDEKTRTVKVRADIENPEGRLRANAFGRARIVTRESPRAIAVPNEAIQWEGCCHVVFVRIADEIFQTRKVRLGVRDGAFTEVQVGVLPGEVVVTKGSHVLKSEILKSRLGAGCVDD